MTAEPGDAEDLVLRLHAPPAQTVPLVFCSPHSGREYPDELLAATRLSPLALRKSEDCFVDELFMGVVKLGAPLLAARFPRAFVDVNREPYELDPELFFERIPAYANSHSVRVVGGLGTIPRIVADGEDIYAERMPLAHGLDRIERYYRPFHAALGALLDATLDRFGIAILIDCHSMPSASSGPTPGQRPHMILGDRFGASCGQWLTRSLRDAMTSCGYDVRLNRPYAGGFITEHYGKPARGVHALQIEINRALYLDEGQLTKAAGFDRLAANLRAIVEAVLRSEPWSRPNRVAAE